MVGQNIGKYRVIDRIGRGGMGTVYRALDETLHREVAIKVLNAELNDPEVAKRFRAEAITVARLSHPGIATIYELFQNDGQWLMVMEFVRGETLEHMVERAGALGPQRTAELCMQALGALAHAHSMGVVHRDLKPANIMITEAGVIKIMDFGIARVAGTEHLTNAGFMMGTPAYMAPEQVLGHEIDARADLYAMGVVFYRLTTAKLPFKGETPFAMAQSQVNDPPTPIGLVRSDLPPWVEQVIVRALAKSPDDRFQSAIEFHESLARCLAGLPMRTEYASSAPTELLLTPPRMPTGSIVRSPTPPPMTGAPPQPSGAQPLATAAVGVPLDSGAQSAAGEFASADETVLASVTDKVHGPAGQAPVASAPAPPPVNAKAAAPPVPPSGAPASATTSGELPKPIIITATPAAAGPGSSAPAPASTSPSAMPHKKGSGALVGIAAVVILAVAGGGVWFATHRGVASSDQSAAVSTEPAAPVPQASPSAPPDTSAPAATGSALPDTTTAPSTSTTAGAPTTAASAPARGASAGRTAPVASTTSGPAAAGKPLPPVPIAAIEDTPQSFPNARVLVVTGKKTDDQDVVVTFGGGRIAAVAKKGQTTLASTPYASLAGATYVHARDPKWNAELPSPPADLDVGGMLRTAKHWLVLQSREGYMILRLDDSNWRGILQAVTARTGVAVTSARTSD